MRSTTNDAIHFLVHPALDFIDLIDSYSVFFTVLGVTAEMFENVRVIAEFMIGDFVSNLTVNRIVRKVIAAAGNQRITAHPVVANLADIQQNVRIVASNNNVHRKLPL